MNEVNGMEARPIKIKNQYEFEIEDTSRFAQYSSGGFVNKVKISKKVQFDNISNQIQNPKIP